MGNEQTVPLDTRIQQTVADLWKSAQNIPKDWRVNQGQMAKVIKTLLEGPTGTPNTQGYDEMISRSIFYSLPSNKVPPKQALEWALNLVKLMEEAVHIGGADPLDFASFMSAATCERVLSNYGSRIKELDKLYRIKKIRDDARAEKQRVDSTYAPIALDDKRNVVEGGWRPIQAYRQRWQPLEKSQAATVYKPASDQTYDSAKATWKERFPWEIIAHNNAPTRKRRQSRPRPKPKRKTKTTRRSRRSSKSLRYGFI